VDQVPQFLFALVDADHLVADAVPHGLVLLLAALETE
jgi:hypothetical protein